MLARSLSPTKLRLSHQVAGEGNIGLEEFIRSLGSDPERKTYRKYRKIRNDKSPSSRSASPKVSEASGKKSHEDEIFNQRRTEEARSNRLTAERTSDGRGRRPEASDQDAGGLLKTNTFEASTKPRGLEETNAPEKEVAPPTTRDHGIRRTKCMKRKPSSELREFVKRPPTEICLDEYRFPPTPTTPTSRRLLECMPGSGFAGIDWEVIGGNQTKLRQPRRRARHVDPQFNDGLTFAKTRSSPELDGASPTRKVQGRVAKASDASHAETEHAAITKQQALAIREEQSHHQEIAVQESNRTTQPDSKQVSDLPSSLSIFRVSDFVKHKAQSALVVSNQGPLDMEYEYENIFEGLQGDGKDLAHTATTRDFVSAYGAYPHPPSSALQTSAIQTTPTDVLKASVTPHATSSQPPSPALKPSSRQSTTTETQRSTANDAMEKDSREGEQSDDGGDTEMLDSNEYDRAIHLPNRLQYADEFHQAGQSSVRSSSDRNPQSRLLFASAPSLENMTPSSLPTDPHGCLEILDSQFPSQPPMFSTQ